MSWRVIFGRRFVFLHIREALGREGASHSYSGAGWSWKDNNFVPATGLTFAWWDFWCCFRLAKWWPQFQVRREFCHLLALVWYTYYFSAIGFNVETVTYKNLKFQGMVLYLQQFLTCFSLGSWRWGFEVMSCFKSGFCWLLLSFRALTKFSSTFRPDKHSVRAFHWFGYSFPLSR